MRAPRRPARRLRLAIDCMPLETRTAMRDALDAGPIIVGAYTDRDGGVCPMLAAHRNGGRTSVAAFARAWDRYTSAGRTPRRATAREVRVLAAMLEASIALEGSDGVGALGAAIAEHRAARGRSSHDERARPPREESGERPSPLDSGERDRTSELGARQGWAWLRPVRRLDEYRQALEQVEEGGLGGFAGPQELELRHHARG